MNKIIFLLILLLPCISFGQDDYVLEKKESTFTKILDKKNEVLHKLSFALLLSASVNESESVPSGLLDSNNNNVNVNINGGNAIGISITYLLNNRMNIELGYNYVVSGMENGYFDNGFGYFERNTLTPILSYAPFTLEKHNFLMKGGINYVFKNAIIIDFDLPTGNTKLTYDYGKSIGFLMAAEYEFRSKKTLSPRVGILYSLNQFKFIKGTINGRHMRPRFVPNSTNSFESNSLFIYFSLAINLKIRENKTQK